MAHSREFRLAPGSHDELRKLIGQKAKKQLVTFRSDFGQDVFAFRVTEITDSEISGFGVGNDLAGMEITVNLMNDWVTINPS